MSSPRRLSHSGLKYNFWGSWAFFMLIGILVGQAVGGSYSSIMALILVVYLGVRMTTSIHSRKELP